MLDESDIQKLLRLKRYEQPPPGYHERFLQEFQRRQRAEMLRQPVWKIALDRIGAFFSEHNMWRTAYGGATVAVLLFAGVASYKIVNSGGTAPASPRVAIEPGTPAPTTTVADAVAQPPRPLHFGLDVQPLPTLPVQAVDINQTDPHYTLGSRPESYVRPYSF